MNADILLVEDNPTDAELIIRALKKNNAGSRIIHLANGAEAMTFLFGEQQSETRHLKVILLDLKMPKVDGFEVLQRIKTDPVIKHIPVIVLTSSAEDPDIKKCYQIGVSSYVVKPVDFETLNKVVMQIGVYWLMVNQPLLR